MDVQTIEMNQSYEYSSCRGHIVYVLLCLSQPKPVKIVNSEKFLGFESGGASGEGWILSVVNGNLGLDSLCKHCDAVDSRSDFAKLSKHRRCMCLHFYCSLPSPQSRLNQRKIPMQMWRCIFAWFVSECSQFCWTENCPRTRTHTPIKLVITNAHEYCFSRESHPIPRRTVITTAWSRKKNSTLLSVPPCKCLETRSNVRGSTHDYPDAFDDCFALEDLLHCAHN